MTASTLRLPPRAVPVRRRPVRRWNAAVLGLTAAGYLLLGWQRRWISDDGLIVVRTVRQVLAGNGPVFNVGERAEANTSTLWTYLLVAVGAVTRQDTGALAVLLGLVLAVGGLLLGMDAARRLHARPAGPVRVLPLGALVVLALPPFWDFATSGLETGLVFAWLAAASWSLVRCAPSRDREPAAPRVVLGTAVLLGLAPLVRPELTVVAATHLLALWWLRGRGTRPLLRLGAVAAVLPVAYEVFRAGYYGLLVPSTALAKAAGSALWGRGWTYTADLARPYALELPVLLAVVALAAVLLRGRRDDATLPLVAAPVGGGLLLFAYVLRVGGDFMHARMLLPPLFLLLLPVLVVPVRRAAVVLAALVAVWAVVCGTSLRLTFPGQPVALDPATGIADERAYWTAMVGDPHPVTGRDFVAHDPPGKGGIEKLRAAAPSSVSWYPNGVIRRAEPRTDLPWRFSVVTQNLGIASVLTGLDERVVDPLGLNFPLAAHAELGARGRPGHEKVLPDAYLLADVAAPGSALPPDSASEADVELARQVLGCGAVAELQSAVRDPMTPGRFWSNLTGAVGRTRFTVPLDPADAVARFCR